MNRIYKIINNSLGVSQVVGEFAKGSKKTNLDSAFKSGILFAAFFISAPSAWAACDLESSTIINNREVNVDASTDSNFCAAWGGNNIIEMRNNQITLQNINKVTATVYAAYFSVMNTQPVISNNTIIINNSTIGSASAAFTYFLNSASGVVTVSQNKVILNNSNAVQVWGAYINVMANGTLSGNKVILNGNSNVGPQAPVSSKGDVSGAVSLATNGLITKNEVILNDNSSTLYAFGGQSVGNKKASLITENSVTLNDNSKAHFIYGGYASFASAPTSFDSNYNGQITGNIVSLNGASSIEAGGEIYGGFIRKENMNQVDIVTGNTFNFNTSNHITLSKMGNFETYNIALPKNGEHYFQNHNSKDQALIIVTELFGNQTVATNQGLAQANLMIEKHAFTKTEIDEVSEGGAFYILNTEGVTYEHGDKLEDNIVINKNNNAAALNLGKNSFNVGTIYILDTELKMNEHSVYLEISDITETEEPEKPIDPEKPEIVDPEKPKPPLTVDKNAIDRNSPVLDSKIAALSILNSGNNLSHDILIGLEPTQQGEIIAFGKVAGKHNKAKGTSDIHINGVNAILGAGVSLSDKTILGGYFEYGYGHYDSTRDFASYKNGNSIFSDMHYKGHGNVNYQGLGALIKAYTNNNFYVNAGAKIGVISTNYSSTSFTDYNYRATNLDYSKSKLYFGAQVGTGFKYQLSENSQLNSSINFIYSQIGSNSFIMDDSEIKLNKVKSERLVWNEEYKYYINQDIGLKLSGAFDYEFSAISNGSIDGYKMTNSSLRGASVVLGTGILFTPFSDKENQYFDLSLNASTGKNQSLGGSFSFNYNL